MSYQTLMTLKNKNFSGKRILVIGAGWMSKQYCMALKQLRIKDVCIISRSEKSSMECCREFGFKPFHGGYKKCLMGMETFDLVIVATQVNELVPAALSAIENGNLKILIEKPGSLYAKDLKLLEKKARDAQATVRVAYNRLLYPNYWKLKELIGQEGGITSCRYTFTELIRGIDFNKESKNVYERWGIANSLHVISMAHSLIGMPKKFLAYHQGRLSWHPSGSRFAGAGITEQGILFSYHADWESGGRWGIETMTSENAYRLLPLEGLFRCKKGTFNWEEVAFESPFPDVKSGVAEEIAIMLSPRMENDLPLVSLKKAGDYIELAEKIFGYK